MSALRTRIGGLTAALVVLGCGLAPAAGAAVYAALGDSYSAGVGTGDYDPASGTCTRSPQGYPPLVAARLGAALTFVACGGATARDVLSSQVASLGGATSEVTISVGGNDAGFADVLKTCLTSGPFSDCDHAIDGAEAFARGPLGARLDAVYGEIAGRAPQAIVAVVGYPHLFDHDRACGGEGYMSQHKRDRLNEAADVLDAVVQGHAASHGFLFVDPRAPFAGHAVCDDAEWLNGISPSRFDDSFHPNALGYRSYADAVFEALTAAP